MEKKKRDKALVFGTFDGLHPGHVHFLNEATREAVELIVIVARDKTVRRLKGRAPELDENSRLQAVIDSGIANKAFLGDHREGEYLVFLGIAPDVVCLGYDQKALGEDLARRMLSGVIPETTIKYISAHKPHKYHTSIIRKNYE